MKQVFYTLLISLCFLLPAHTAQAQLFYRTVAAGNWNNVNTWQSATDAGFTVGVTATGVVKPTDRKSVV